MKFWKWLARICTALFIALLVFSWLANGRRAAPDLKLPDDTPPAPVFR
jgi:hypothetical protein